MVTRVSYPLLKLHLRRRLKRGKENPERWREKLGEPTLTRPDGPLIWLHAVGLGEILALRGMIDLLTHRHPEAHFLVTSGTRASAEVFGANLPPRTIHQFAPIDVKGPINRFLDFWRPDLSIWAEQDIWPGLVHETSVRGIPIALINARMNDAGFSRRRRWKGLFSDVFSRFDLLSCQDTTTAAHLAALGARNPRVDGSLKPLSPPLAVDEAELAKWRTRTEGCFVWIVGSSHEEDEEIAIQAHIALIERIPDAVLVIAPRDPGRGADILGNVENAGLNGVLRSQSTNLTDLPQVYVADTFGEMGLWYRLARAAMIGGTFGSTEGHNPWEARVLGVPVVFGSRTANFAADFDQMETDGVGQQVSNAQEIAGILSGSTLAMLANAASEKTGHSNRILHALADDLIALITSGTGDTKGGRP